jgi:pilus assembly protein Flp/PilA
MAPRLLSSLSDELERPAPGVARAITGLLDSPCKEERIMGNFMKRLVHEESGQGMAEYGLLLLGIAIVVYAAVKLVGNNANNLMNNVASNLGS